MALALTELLASLPKSHSGYNEIEQRFRSYMDIILKYQDENGMWRQIIDREDAYPETSGTALILYSLAHGVRNKLLPYNLLEIIENGYAGLLDMIEEDGTIHGTCIGTPFQINEDAYFNLPAPVDDLHGHGPVILACAEIALLRGLSGNP
jgi:rhamnogalacturonyl hydrolase YesR